MILLSSCILSECSQTSYLSFRDGQLHCVVIKVANKQSVNKHLQKREKNKENAVALDRELNITEEGVLSGCSVQVIVPALHLNSV